MKVIVLLGALLVFQTVQAVERMLVNSVEVVQPSESLGNSIDLESDWLNGTGIKTEEEKAVCTENRNEN